jgi:quinol monooxygenase YgiN
VLTFVCQTRVADENSAAFEALLQEMCETVAANEPGCVHYGFGRSQDEPGTYVILEVFCDQAAHDAHNQMPYVPALLPKVAALVTDGKFEVRKYVGG